MDARAHVLSDSDFLADKLLAECLSKLHNETFPKRKGGGRMSYRVWWNPDNNLEYIGVSQADINLIDDDIILRY
jgi:hypothetical protein